MVEVLAYNPNCLAIKKIRKVAGLNEESTKGALTVPTASNIVGDYGAVRDRNKTPRSVYRLIPNQTISS